MAKYNYTHPPPPFIPVCVTPLPYRLPPSPSSPHPHTHSSALHSPKSRHVCLIVSENRCRKTAIRASSPCFCSFSLCMAVSTLSPQFVSVMLYRFRLSKYERYPLDCYHSNQNVNRNPSLNSASLLFRLLGELDVLVRFWWGSSPALPPPHAAPQHFHGSASLPTSHRDEGREGEVAALHSSGIAENNSTGCPALQSMDRRSSDVSHPGTHTHTALTLSSTFLLTLTQPLLASFPRCFSPLACCTLESLEFQW